MILQRIIDASRFTNNAFMHHRDPREIIRDLRLKRGFTSDRSLAIAAGIPQPTLSRYLAGKAETMELASFQALARTLEVTVSELTGEVPLDERPDVRRLSALYDELDEPARAALLAAAAAMASSKSNAKN
ncbi:helix-turn-helix transcriptional regulator [Aquincola sp. J276]|uniref:helix-turn-helix domain-containing protein n=1 Tax=Aquincola sp. J276 TaxID=2898432 RepID=UPI0021514BB6|nr:helix-turn-helix transcriptional regulator [Aquincola sp. J276]MCR5864670.1 helix-turn-helix domain-containing protein [Aquincola sp. J276]